MAEFNVANMFETFCNNLRFLASDQSTISTRYKQITKRINIDYYSSLSDTTHSFYVGSYGRDTEISTSDIDMLVVLPYETYQKFNKYTSNGQSALLQEVKQCLLKTYSTTKLKADGQIISIPFSDGINFEVLPAFLNDKATYTFPNSNDGGSWKITDPKSEIDAIQTRDNYCNKNLKRLCKMTRAWKGYNSVDISGILIDILAYNFIIGWEYKDKSFLYYDWMTRDFMQYVSKQPSSQYKWQVMGSGRYITCLGDFQKKAKDAYETAIEAIAAQEKYAYTANQKWRSIYGTKFPNI